MNKKTLLEFFRYILVGGSAFLIDIAVMFIFKEFIFQGHFLYLAVFLGYMAGLVYNFYFSCKYVFENGFNKIKDKEIKSFVIFTIIGIIGLGLTELLMRVFVEFAGIYYVVSKVLTGIIVMFWNYIARKIIIFK